jgi:hypothetical protein
LTAIFTQSNEVESVSKRSLYKELTLHVEQVFEDQTGSGHPHAGQYINLLLFGRAGASVPSPTDLSVAPVECEDALRIGHRYLLILSYTSSGDFYEPYDHWDISHDTVGANDPRIQYLIK